jgi:hypothetical protein
MLRGGHPGEPYQGTLRWLEPGGYVFGRVAKVREGLVVPHDAQAHRAISRLRGHPYFGFTRECRLSPRLRSFSRRPR